MKPVLAILIGATIGAGAAHANPPRVVSYRYVEQVAVPYYLPLPVSVPAYSVGAAAQMDPALLERIADLGVSEAAWKAALEASVKAGSGNTVLAPLLVGRSLPVRVWETTISEAHSVLRGQQ